MSVCPEVTVVAEKHLKLLLVEDNPGEARLIRVYLSEAPDLNIELLHVESLAAASEKIAANRIDVMLLDLGLPDSNGLETFTIANRNHPELPIVVLTGHADTELGATAVQGGAQDYLTKGRVDGNVLSHALRYAIERKQASLELEQAYTALKKAQEQLVKSEKMVVIGTLATKIAHEINNPLQVVIGLSEEIAEGEDIAQIHEDARDVLSYTDRITSIVDGLTYYSHDSRTESLIEMVDLNRALKDSLTIARYVPGFKLIKIITDLNEHPPVLANQGELQQVFTNLINNAIAAMPRGGELALTTETCDNCVRTCVRDSGCGIPNTDFDRIFEPFYTTKRAGEGTGMGLYVIHQIITKHRGEIDLVSHEGEGTTFTITFPLAEEA